MAKLTKLQKDQIISDILKSAEWQGLEKAHQDKAKKRLNDILGAIRHNYPENSNQLADYIKRIVAVLSSGAFFDKISGDEEIGEVKKEFKETLANVEGYQTLTAKNLEALASKKKKKPAKIAEILDSASVSIAQKKITTPSEKTDTTNEEKTDFRSLFVSSAADAEKLGATSLEVSEGAQNISRVERVISELPKQPKRAAVVFSADDVSGRKKKDSLPIVFYFADNWHQNDKDVQDNYLCILPLLWARREDIAASFPQAGKSNINIQTVTVDVRSQTISIKLSNEGQNSTITQTLDIQATEAEYQKIKGYIDARPSMGERLGNFRLGNNKDHPVQKVILANKISITTAGVTQGTGRSAGQLKTREETQKGAMVREHTGEAPGILQVFKSYLTAKFLLQKNPESEIYQKADSAKKNLVKKSAFGAEFKLFESLISYEEEKKGKWFSRFRRTGTRLKQVDSLKKSLQNLMGENAGGAETEALKVLDTVVQLKNAIEKEDKQRFTSSGKSELSNVLVAYEKAAQKRNKDYLLQALRNRDLKNLSDDFALSQHRAVFIARFGGSASADDKEINDAIQSWLDGLTADNLDIDEIEKVRILFNKANANINAEHTDNPVRSRLGNFEKIKKDIADKLVACDFQTAANNFETMLKTSNQPESVYTDTANSVLAMIKKIQVDKPDIDMKTWRQFAEASILIVEESSVANKIELQKNMAKAVWGKIIEKELPQILLSDPLNMQSIQNFYRQHDLENFATVLSASAQEELFRLVAGKTVPDTLDKIFGKINDALNAVDNAKKREAINQLQELLKNEKFSLGQGKYPTEQMLRAAFEKYPKITLNSLNVALNHPEDSRQGFQLIGQLLMSFGSSWLWDSPVFSEIKSFLNNNSERVAKEYINLLVSDVIAGDADKSIAAKKELATLLARDSLFNFDGQKYVGQFRMRELFAENYKSQIIYLSKEKFVPVLNDSWTLCYCNSEFRKDAQKSWYNSNELLKTEKAEFLQNLKNPQKLTSFITDAKAELFATIFTAEEIKEFLSDDSIPSLSPYLNYLIKKFFARVEEWRKEYESIAGAENKTEKSVADALKACREKMQESSEADTSVYTASKNYAEKYQPAINSLNEFQEKINKKEEFAKLKEALEKNKTLLLDAIKMLNADNQQEAKDAIIKENQALLAKIHGCILQIQWESEYTSDQQNEIFASLAETIAVFPDSKLKSSLLLVAKDITNWKSHWDAIIKLSAENTKEERKLEDFQKAFSPEAIAIFTFGLPKGGDQYSGVNKTALITMLEAFATNNDKMEIIAHKFINALQNNDPAFDLQTAAIEQLTKAKATDEISENLMRFMLAVLPDNKKAIIALAEAFAEICSRKYKDDEHSPDNSKEIASLVDVLLEDEKISREFMELSVALQGDNSKSSQTTETSSKDNLATATSDFIEKVYVEIVYRKLTGLLSEENNHDKYKALATYLSAQALPQALAAVYRQLTHEQKTMLHSKIASNLQQLDRIYKAARAEVTQSKENASQIATHQISHNDLKFIQTLVQIVPQNAPGKDAIDSNIETLTYRANNALRAVTAVKPKPKYKTEKLDATRKKVWLANAAGILNIWPTANYPAELKARVDALCYRYLILGAQQKAHAENLQDLAELIALLSSQFALDKSEMPSKIAELESKRKYPNSKESGSFTYHCAKLLEEKKSSSLPLAEMCAQKLDLLDAEIKRLGAEIRLNSPSNVNSENLKVPQREATFDSLVLIPGHQESAQLPNNTQIKHFKPVRKAYKLLRQHMLVDAKTISSSEIIDNRSSLPFGNIKSAAEDIMGIKQKNKVVYLLVTSSLDMEVSLLKALMALGESKYQEAQQYLDSLEKVMENIAVISVENEEEIVKNWKDELKRQYFFSINFLRVELDKISQPLPKKQGDSDDGYLLQIAEQKRSADTLAEEIIKAYDNKTLDDRDILAFAEKALTDQGGIEYQCLERLKYAENYKPTLLETMGKVKDNLYKNTKFDLNQKASQQAIAVTARQYKSLSRCEQFLSGEELEKEEQQKQDEAMVNKLLSINFKSNPEQKDKAAMRALIFELASADSYYQIEMARKLVQEVRTKNSNWKETILDCFGGDERLLHKFLFNAAMAESRLNLTVDVALRMDLHAQKSEEEKQKIAEQFFTDIAQSVKYIFETSSDKEEQTDKLYGLVNRMHDRVRYLKPDGENRHELYVYNFITPIQRALNLHDAAKLELYKTTEGIPVKGRDARNRGNDFVRGSYYPMANQTLLSQSHHAVKNEEEPNEEESECGEDVFGKSVLRVSAINEIKVENVTPIAIKQDAKKEQEENENEIEKTLSQGAPKRDSLLNSTCFSPGSSTSRLGATPTKSEPISRVEGFNVQEEPADDRLQKPQGGNTPTKANRKN